MISLAPMICLSKKALKLHFSLNREATQFTYANMYVADQKWLVIQEIHFGI